MFSKFQKFINETLSDLDKKVDATLSPLSEKVNEKVGKPIQDLSKKVEEKVKPVTSGITIESSKRILTSLTQETVKATAGVLTESLAIEVIPAEHYRDDVQINAGLELIQKYEKDMAQIQTNNKLLYIRANETDQKIGPVYGTCLRQRDMWAMLVKDFGALNEVANGIANIKNDIENICSRLDRLEIALTEQLETVAGVELQTWKDAHTKETQRLAEKKLKELANYEQELRIGFVKREQQKLEIEKLKIQQQIEEQRIKAKEKEREDRLKQQQLDLERKKEEARQRELLQQEFQKEFNTYRAYGTLPTRGPDAPKSLDQVELPTDPTVEDFLGPREEKTEEKAPVVEEKEEEEPVKVQLIPDVDLPSPEVPKKEPTKEAAKKEDEKVEDVDESWYT